MKSPLKRILFIQLQLIQPFRHRLCTPSVNVFQEAKGISPHTRLEISFSSRFEHGVFFYSRKSQSYPPVQCMLPVQRLVAAFKQWLPQRTWRASYTRTKNLGQLATAASTATANQEPPSIAAAAGTAQPFASEVVHTGN